MFEPSKRTVNNSLTSLIKKPLIYSLGHVPLSALISKSRENLFLPFYHIISDQAIPHIEELYSIRNTKTFKQDLSFLTTHYTSTSAQELYKKVKNKEFFDQPSFHLTFDDGLKEMLTVVAPILYQQGIHATFFINSAFVDNKDLFYRYKASLLIHHFNNHPPTATTRKEILALFSAQEIKKETLNACLLAVDYKRKHVLDRIAVIAGFDFSDYLKVNQPYLTTNDIAELQKMGFSIGAHSVDHPYYKELTLEEQLHQTKESLNFIKTTFNIPYSYFSFPFSDEKVSKAFFDEIYTSTPPLADLTFGISGLKKDSYPNHLHRFPMEGNELTAETLIKTEYLYYLAKSLLHKNTITRK